MVDVIGKIACNNIARNNHVVAHYSSHIPAVLKFLRPDEALAKTGRQLKDGIGGNYAGGENYIRIRIAQRHFLTQTVALLQRLASIAITNAPPTPAVMIPMGSS